MISEIPKLRNDVERYSGNKFVDFASALESSEKILSEIDIVLANNTNLEQAEKIIYEDYLLRLENSLANAKATFETWKQSIKTKFE
jgi:hypothetical protein